MRPFNRPNALSRQYKAIVCTFQPDYRKMCEGQQDDAVTGNQRTTRRRRSRPQNLHPSESGDEGDAPEYWNAIDGSPAVFKITNGWRECELIPRTPQHLITLIARNPTTYVWSAPPIVWKERYLIAPTLSGHILLWDLRKTLKMASNETDDLKLDDRQVESASKGPSVPNRSLEGEVSDFHIHSSQTPDLVLNTNRDETTEKVPIDSTLANGTAIAQICIGSSSVPGNNNGNNEVLVSASVAGFVHVFHLNDSDLNLITIAYSFSTGKPGLQCVTTTRKGTIVVGYHSGRLEAWKLEARKQPKNVASTPQNLERTAGTSYRKKLLWRGFLANAPEIRSVLQLEYPSIDANSNTEHEPPTISDRDEILILTMQQEEMISTAGMIEVINITAVQKSFQGALQNNESATEVALDECSLLARPGMEVINPTTSLPETQANYDFRNRPWAPNGGTDSLVRIDQPLQGDSMLACAVILAEGSVLLITTFLVDGEFEWGIQRASEQLLLSFPAIGVGCAIQTSGEDTVPNITCCLRGGTSYLIPCDSKDTTETSDSLNVITYPHDIDTDNPPHRVDFFSAGVIRYSVDDRKFTKSSIPILVYCWPGGIIDVYASELLQEKKTYTNAILTELVFDGTVQLLREHLLSLTIEALALRDDSWSLARDELANFISSEPLALSDLLSARLRAFRSILIPPEF